MNKTMMIGKSKLDKFLPLDSFLPPSYNPAQQNTKTLTRTSTLQSDFQRAKPLVEYAEAVYRDQRGASKAKAQKPNGPPSCEGNAQVVECREAAYRNHRSKYQSRELHPLPRRGT